MVPDDQFVSNVVVYIIGSSFDQRSFVKVLFVKSELLVETSHLLQTASFWHNLQHRSLVDQHGKPHDKS